MRHILELAICRGMKFILAIPYDALPRFHITEPPSMLDPTKRTYDVGFQESPLTYDKGRVAFMDQYMGKCRHFVSSLARESSHSIGNGGPTNYGGERLLLYNSSYKHQQWSPSIPQTIVLRKVTSWHGSSGPWPFLSIHLPYMLVSLSKAFNSFPPILSFPHHPTTR